MSLLVDRPPVTLRSEHGRPPATRLRNWIFVYLLGQSIFFYALRKLDRRFFWLDDQQVQFLPTYHWFGRNLLDGRPPLMSPELGNAGNFVADAQYGVYDPGHWLLSALVSRAENLNDAAWIMSGSCVVVLGVGVITLLSHYRCPPVLSVAAALGLANTGFFLWFGSSYWPLMLSTAWLPWFWYGLATPHRRGVLIVGLSAYLLIGAGYPYNLIFAAATVLAQAGERWLRGGFRAVMAREALARAAAGIAGVIAGLPTLLSLAQMVPFTTRTFPVGPLGNPGGFIPSLVDVLVGGSTLTPLVTTTFFGNLLLAPVAATAVFAVPALVLVRWRAVWRHPGVLTALALLALAVVATQTPTYVGPLRYPWRYLALVGLYMPLLVVLGLTYGAAFTKKRLVAAAVILAGQAGLAVLRAPALVWWHLVALLVASLAVAGLVAAASATRRSLVVAGMVTLLATAVGAPLVGERSAVSSQAKVDVASGAPVTGRPSRSLVTRPEWGETVADFRQQSVAVGKDLTVLAWGGDLSTPASGWGNGVLTGNANLLSDLLPGFSYAASAQAGWAIRGCQDHVGQHLAVPGCIEGLLAPVPGLNDVSWIEAMSSDEVLLSQSTPPEIIVYFEQRWRAAGSIRTYLRYVRKTATPGRVTGTAGQVTQVEQRKGDAQLAYGGRPFDSYRVTTEAGGGELVLRIPYWPGLRASVDGRPVSVTDIDRTLTAIRLPADLDQANLQLEFRPVGEVLLWPSMALGAVGVLLATAAARPFRRRDDQRRDGASDAVHPLPTSSARHAPEARPESPDRASG